MVTAGEPHASPARYLSARQIIAPQKLLDRINVPIAKGIAIAAQT